MKKLTPEELSLVLSESAIDRLHFATPGVIDGQPLRGTLTPGCGCVGGRVLNTYFNDPDRFMNPEQNRRFWELSDATTPRSGQDLHDVPRGGYPKGPTAMLRFLEQRKLA